MTDLKIIGLDVIIEYVQGVKKRPLVQGEEVLNAKHILMCGRLKCNDNNILRFRGLCLQSSGINDPPHEVSIEIGIDETIKSCKCSCKAGLGGKCKHIIAVLLYLNRKFRHEVEDLSCTDLVQKWGELSCSNQGKVRYEPKKLNKLCHAGAVDFKKYVINEETDQEIERILSLGAPFSQHVTFQKMSHSNQNDPEIEYSADDLLILSLLHQIISSSDHMVIEDDGYIYKMINNSFNKIELSNLPKDYLSYYEKFVKVNIEQAIEIAVQTSSQGGSKWLDERNKRITGSQCYSVYTYSRNKNPNWKSKFDSLGKDSPLTSAMKHGLKYEKDGIKAYQVVKGCNVENVGLIVLPQVPWIGYSPDGIVSSSHLVEVKCPEVGSAQSAFLCAKQMKYLEELQYNKFILKKHHPYYGQVQLGMAICNLKKCDLVIYAPHDQSVEIVDVLFDIDFVTDLLITLKYVYFMHKLPYLVNKK